jgi:hypothetical protein
MSPATTQARLLQSKNKLGDARRRVPAGIMLINAIIALKDATF